MSVPSASSAHRASRSPASLTARTDADVLDAVVAVWTRPVVGWTWSTAAAGPVWVPADAAPRACGFAVPLTALIALPRMSRMALRAAAQPTRPGAGSVQV